MRPALRAVAVLCAALAGTPVLAASAGGRTPVRAARASSHLRVTQVEYRLILSQGSVAAGTLDLAEIDRGSASHDLRLRRDGGGPTIQGRLLSPGGSWNGVVHLSPGVYTLWCSLPEHARRGMHTTLRVLP